MMNNEKEVSNEKTREESGGSQEIGGNSKEEKPAEKVKEEAKEELKVEEKPEEELKVEVKEEVKAEVKPEEEPKVKVKEEVKAEIKPEEEPKVEAKEELKVEEKSEEEKKVEIKEPEKKPEPEESGTLGIVAAVAILLLIAVFLYWDNKGKQQKFIPPRPSPPASSQIIIQEADRLQEALDKVKDFTGAKTEMKLIARLDSYKMKKEQDSNIKIEMGDWKARPTKDKEETLRYYDVTFEWKEDGNPVKFIWQIDLKTGKVIPMNEASKEVEKFDEYLWETLTKAPVPAETLSPKIEETPKEPPIISPEVTPETSLQVPPSPEETPRGTPKPVTTLKPLTKDKQKIDILPPVSPEEVVSSPSKKETMPAKPSELPPVDTKAEEFYKLIGVMSIGSTRTAMFEKEGKVYEGKVGTRLPDGWVVRFLTPNSVVLKKGNQTRSLKLEIRRSTPSGKRGQTSTAASNGRVQGRGFSPGGPPLTRGIVEAPPVPPEPGSTVRATSSPAEQLTIIPTD